MVLDGAQVVHLVPGTEKGGKQFAVAPSASSTESVRSRA